MKVEFESDVKQDDDDTYLTPRLDGSFAPYVHEQREIRPYKKARKNIPQDSRYPESLEDYSDHGRRGQHYCKVNNKLRYFH